MLKGFPKENLKLMLLSITQFLINWVLFLVDNADYFFHFALSLYWNILTLGIFPSARSKPGLARSKDKKKNWVLVTGCSTGIGNAAALYLAAQEGVRVFATVRSSMDEEWLTAKDPAGNVKPVLMDVTDERSVARAVRTIKDTLDLDGSRLIAVINNAGISCPGIIELCRVDTIKSVMDVNLHGVVRVVQAFLPLLRGAKGDGGPARIINVSSVAGLFSTAVIGPYSASKYALEAISDALSRELSAQNITVSIVEPGKL